MYVTFRDTHREAVVLAAKANGLSPEGFVTAAAMAAVDVFTEDNPALASAIDRLGVCALWRATLTAPICATRVIASLIIVQTMPIMLLSTLRRLRRLSPDLVSAGFVILPSSGRRAL